MDRLRALSTVSEALVEAIFRPRSPPPILACLHRNLSFLPRLRKCVSHPSAALVLQRLRRLVFSDRFFVLYRTTEDSGERDGVLALDEKRWANRSHPRLADPEDRRGEQLRRGQVGSSVGSKRMRIVLPGRWVIVSGVPSHGDRQRLASSGWASGVRDGVRAAANLVVSADSVGTPTEWQAQLRSNFSIPHRVNRTGGWANFRKTKPKLQLLSRRMKWWKSMFQEGIRRAV